jgi:MTH538 TIR-like domain (DUF1863)
MATFGQRSLQAWIQTRELRLSESLTIAQKAARHKCFVSYHHEDEDEVKVFLENYESIFIPRVLGVSDEDDFIDSKDTDYIMGQIREKYLTDSTVTIVLVGKCTWARRYVDWEVYSTLRNDKSNKRSGLVAIDLPSIEADASSKKLPLRVGDNVNDDKGYARWWKYPSTSDGLTEMIDEAFDARTIKANLIVNTRDRKLNNLQCP